MFEPAVDVGAGNGRQGGPGGGAEGVVGPGGGASEERLELGERLLDGVAVRGVGREVPEVGASGLDRSAGSVAVVGAEVVGDDDLARSEGRGEAVDDVPFEAIGGHGAVEAEGRA